MKTSFKSKNIVSTSRLLQLLHIELIGLLRIKSHGGNYYVFMIIDDFSRFTWTLFLSHNSDTFQAFKNLAKVCQKEKGSIILSLKSDYRGEFENQEFPCYCIENRISHNVFAPRTL